jgi:hypothetical protein
MAEILYNQSPKTSDIVLIQITTPDYSDVVADPYSVDSVTVYFIKRSYDEGGLEGTNVFDDPISATSTEVVARYGNSDLAAWDSTDTDLAQIEKITVDEEGSLIFGTFQARFDPDGQEGEYYATWQWTPVFGGERKASALKFRVDTDNRVTGLPTKPGIPGRFEHLMDIYIPSGYRQLVSENDLSPNIIKRFGEVVAKLFTDQDDLVDQILTGYDPNYLKEPLLRYLSHNLGWKLKSSKPALWRRQLKEAINLYKKRGTRDGLAGALASAGMSLLSIKQLWQTGSDKVRTDGFLVGDSLDFILSRVPLLPISSYPLNFSLSVKRDGDNFYTNLSTTTVSFSISSGVCTMSWIGNTLPVPVYLYENDYLKVTYQYDTVVDQTLEDYIKTLPLLDTRDEVAEAIHPPKNWNIVGIHEDDDYFSDLITVQHPYRNPVVYGQVRTTFQYSEKLYNSESFNGSVRDSTDPCDLDADFVDELKNCLSSSLIIDIKVTELSDDRMREAEEICKDFLPFDARINTLNFFGSVEEIVLPPEETTETFIWNNPIEYILQGDDGLVRFQGDQVESLTRDALSSAVSAASRTDGFGRNIGAKFYCPNFISSVESSGLDLSSNILRVLSGINADEYVVTGASNNDLEVDDVTDPNNGVYSPFKLWNLLLVDASASVTQTDKNVFFDSSSTSEWISQNIVAGWKVTISNGPAPGTYIISEVLPNGQVVLNTWSSTASSGLTYQLLLPDNTPVLTGTSGVIAISRHGTVAFSTPAVTQTECKVGDQIEIDDVQYPIIEVLSTTQVLIYGWTDGNVGGIEAKILRPIGAGVCTAGVRGTILETTVDHYSVLGVQTALDNDNRMENYYVLIEGKYSRILSWSTTVNGFGRYEIELDGEELDWGVLGTSGISYTIVRFERISNVVVNGTTIRTTQRGSREKMEYVTETVLPMAFSPGPFLTDGWPHELIGQKEVLNIDIQYIEE